MFSPAGKNIFASSRQKACPAYIVFAWIPPPTRFGFRLKIRAAFKPASVLLAIAGASGRDTGPAHISNLGQDPLWSETAGFSPARSRVFTTGEHYQQVTALAALQRAMHPAASRTGEAALISFIVPTYNTPARYLDDLLASFLNQEQGFAELILSDDGSSTRETLNWLDAHEAQHGVTILRNPVNRGIAAATTAGIGAAQGSWLGLLDHDDALSPHAVFLLAKTIADFPRAQFIYTDEIVTDKSLQPVDYFLKPAFDDVLLSSVNYINHLSLYRKDRVEKIGGLREGFEGSQDYDLLLRYLAGLEASEILHLPYPAYLWRRDGRSYSSRALEKATANARHALALHYAQGDVQGIVEPALAPTLHRIRFDLAQTKWPKVSIIIPNRDGFALIQRVLDHLTTKTDYPDIEIIIIDNGSTNPKVLNLYDEFARKHPSSLIRIEAEPFNFSRSINKGLRLASGAYILLLNNDIEVMEPLWLREMVSCFAYPRTGIVGARLLYPDLTVQHAGVIIGLGGLAGHWFCGKPSRYPGPMGRLHLRQTFSSVTGACMLISRACFEAVGFFRRGLFCHRL